MGITEVTIAFLAMLGLLVLGMPVAVVMVLIGVAGGMMAFGWPIIASAGPVVWGAQNENILTAIPLFILMGELLLRGGIADRMYGALAVWLNRLPGGLIHTNIGACAMFAATSGSSVATAATIGTVALPALDARGYPKPQALGSLAAGGTLGILIPPSVALLVYGSITNNSIGQLFIAGIVPGVLLTLSFMVYILVSNMLSHGTPVEVDVPLREKLAQLRFLIPPMIIFGVVMGSIYFGIATPTESAALGVVAALFFAAAGRRLSWTILAHAFIRTAELTGMIILIIVGSFILNVTLSLLGVAQIMTQWIGGLGISATELLLAMVVFYLILGCFMEVLSMQVATIPIAYPIVTHMGIDPLWFGIFVVLMSEIAMITPPVGMNLYVVQGVRQDRGAIGDVIRGVVPYVAIMLVFTGLLIAFPGLATWLPSHM
ncbi:C4-dicarboxylate transporter DctM subunit [Constrictibacter sp. MBR-5]|jgi:tripartite ATP-independent transporter DctM subunit|uniref:TRAP transporter large permease n=1 Tax=Constrictibacter sp. MBR-5 TaxID=3156467 RepID=UPI003391F347